MLAIGTAIRKHKRRTLAVVVLLVLASIGTWWWLRNPLNEFVDLDLRKLDENSRLTALAKKTLGWLLPEDLLSSRVRLGKLLDQTLPSEFQYGRDLAIRNMRVSGFGPWYLWRLDGNTEARFVLFQVRHAMMHPGAGWAAVHFLNGQGKHLAYSLFSIGWRCDIVDAKLIREENCGAHVIVIETRGTLGGPNGRQYYAIDGQRVALVRTEDVEGKFVANFYDAGPEASREESAGPVRNAEDWQALLNSENRHCVLEALCWLGGDRRGAVPELAATLRQSPQMQARIAMLAQSEIAWIRDAAQALQKPNGD